MKPGPKFTDVTVRIANCSDGPKPKVEAISKIGATCQSATRHRHEMTVSSVQNRRQVGASRLVIETDGHECPLVDEPQTAIQSPAEHIVVARRHKKSWPGESRRGADQRFQIFVAFADCMSE